MYGKKVDQVQPSQPPLARPWKEIADNAYPTRKPLLLISNFSSLLHGSPRARLRQSHLRKKLLIGNSFPLFSVPSRAGARQSPVFASVSRTTAKHQNAPEFCNYKSNQIIAYSCSAESADSSVPNQVSECRNSLPPFRGAGNPMPTALLVSQNHRRISPPFQPTKFPLPKLVRYLPTCPQPMPKRKNRREH